MKFRITPLNIIAAAALLAAILLLFNQVEFFAFKVSGMKILFVILFFMAAIVSFISDVIFRKMIPSLKRLWLIELSLITLTAVMIVFLKSVFL